MSRKMAFFRINYVFMFIIIGWFIAAFIVAPVIGVLYEIFFSTGSFSLEAIGKLASSERTINALTNTFKMAFFTVITVNIIGIFQIMITEYLDIKGSRFLEMSYFTPLLYGGISLVTGYNYVYSSNGFVTKILTNIFPNMDPNWFVGFTAVLFVHTLSMTTFHILFVKTAFRQIDYSTIEACRSLGGGKVTAFFKVALPVIMPSIFSATILVALGALNSFAAPSMLGGRDFYMINTMIQTLNGTGSKDLAALLSLILAMTCILLLIVMRWFEKRRNYISVSKVPTKLQKTKIRNPIINVTVHLVAYFISFLYLLPIVSIIFFSFTDISNIIAKTWPDSLTFDNYIHVFSQASTLEPLLTSVKLSLIAVAIMLVICIVSSIAIHKHPNKATNVLEFALLIPWILPATMLAVGLISAYATPSLIVFNAVLIGSFWLLPIAYAVMQIPQGMRLIRASLYTVNSSHEEAARSLGAGVVYTFFKVVIPAILPTVASVGAITFNVLLSEYALSALIYNVNNVPLGIVLRQPESNPDPNSAANTLVYIVVLMVISATTLLITRKTRNRY